MDRISMIFALLSVAISIQGAATFGTKLLSMRTSATQAQVAAAPAFAPSPVVVQPANQVVATAEPAPWIAVRSDVHAGARMQSRHSKRSAHAAR